MLRYESSAPIWLFSFVDLAFLLLIAFTQIDPHEPAPEVPLATLEVPRVRSPGTPLERSTAASRWQLRVHSLRDAGHPDTQRRPFVLVEPGAEPTSAATLDERDLAQGLATLVGREIPKPVLAPHPDARAEDLLVAVGLLDERWRDRRSVAVKPTPAVAAAPLDDPAP